MKKQLGTKKQLNLQVGDVVKIVDSRSPSAGNTYTINKHLKLRNNDGSGHYFGYVNDSICEDTLFEVLSRATATQHKMWRDMSAEEKGALLLAHHEGKTIEFWDEDAWIAAEQPLFTQYDKYRVKPEPRVEIVCMYYNTGDSIMTTYKGKKDSFKVSFKVVDGEPDCSSVVLEKI